MTDPADAELSAAACRLIKAFPIALMNSLRSDHDIKTGMCEAEIACLLLLIMSTGLLQGVSVTPSGRVGEHTTCERSQRSASSSGQNMRVGLRRSVRCSSSEGNFTERVLFTRPCLCGALCRPGGNPGASGVGGDLAAAAFGHSDPAGAGCSGVSLQGQGGAEAAD